MRGLKYVTVSKSSILMPLIILENDSKLELRDSLIRSSRNDNDQSLDKSEWTLKEKSSIS
jgi:hypothetical protein